MAHVKLLWVDNADSDDAWSYGARIRLLWVDNTGSDDARFDACPNGSNVTCSDSLHLSSIDPNVDSGGIELFRI